MYMYAVYYIYIYIYIYFFFFFFFFFIQPEHCNNCYHIMQLSLYMPLSGSFFTFIYSVLRCTPLDGDFPGILDHIVIQIFVDGCRNWTQVYVMMELYIMIAKVSGLIKHVVAIMGVIYYFSDW